MRGSRSHPKACQLLCWGKILAVVMDVDDTERELIAIDENLTIRPDPTQTRESTQMAERTLLGAASRDEAWDGWGGGEAREG